MNRIRYSKILTYLWLFLALWIFDYSIDIPDPQSDAVAEDLSYNDMESISEFIFEYCLDWENFVPEHDEDDPDDSGGFAKKIEVAFVLNRFIIKEFPINYLEKSEQYNNYTLVAPKIPFISELTKPPQV